MTAVLDRELLFVTGKGGVGKTTTAAAIAEVAVRAGKRVLVCEMDSKGAIAAAFDAPRLGFEAIEVRPRLFAMAMNTEDSLREYLRVMARVPLVGRIGPVAHMLDFVADAAPGVKEILAIGKICYEVREHNYDLVVVDAEASGHIVSQIDAPRAIRELVQVGPIRDQTEWMMRILADPERTGVVVATTPEEMPITETLELVAKVGSATEVDVAAVFLNRMLPAWFDGRDRSVFDALRGTAAQTLLADAVGPKVGVVFEAAALAQSRHDVAQRYLQRLREELPPSVELHELPELFTKASGRRVVSLLADELQRVLG